MIEEEKTIRVLIADDHLIIREGMRLILETEKGFELVGEACNGEEAIRLANELHPDVVLMDLRMPGMGGLQAIEYLHQNQPELPVVILTTYNEDELMKQGLRAGARGYLLKDTDRKSLFNALRAAVRGETLLKPEVLSRLLAEPERVSQHISTRRGLQLTDRESAILAAVAQGDRTKEIALHLGITERTVKAHLASIYNKLGVDSRAAAIAVAAQQGLLPPSPD
jgi:NarL family two-component system response regulator YdfI